MRCVLGKIKEAGLKCRPSKCEFGKKKVVYLGHVIGDGVMAVPQDRVEAIRSYKKPVTRKQLRSFLGLVRYYRKFIRDFAESTSVLSPLMSPKVPARVEWTPEKTAAFYELCNVLSCNVCL